MIDMTNFHRLTELHIPKLRGSDIFSGDTDAALVNRPVALAVIMPAFESLSLLHLLILCVCILGTILHDICRNRRCYC